MIQHFYTQKYPTLIAPDRLKHFPDGFTFIFYSNNYTHVSRIVNEGSTLDKQYTILRVCARDVRACV